MRTNPTEGRFDPQIARDRFVSKARGWLPWQSPGRVKKGTGEPKEAHAFFDQKPGSQTPERVHYFFRRHIERGSIANTEYAADALHARRGSNACDPHVVVEVNHLDGGTFRAIITQNGQLHFPQRQQSIPAQTLARIAAHAKTAAATLRT